MTLSWRATGSEKIPFRPYIVAINEIHFYRIGRGPRRDPVLVESIELASTTRVDSKEIINRSDLIRIISSCACIIQETIVEIGVRFF